ncbi:MAG: penicillin-binding transpeptidase domain-containing protein [Alphaproteobacteria bacterium]
MKNKKILLVIILVITAVLSLFIIQDKFNKEELSVNNTTQTVEITKSQPKELNSTIQRILEDGVDMYNAKGGVAIVMNANTSQVIVDISVSNKNEIINYSTNFLYEPGAIMNAFTVAMGLENKVISDSSVLDVSTPLKLGNATIKDYRGENRELSLSESLIHSSNIGAAQIGLKVGAENQKLFLNDINLFNQVSADALKPQAPKKWEEENIAVLSYGYGFLTTPLNIISAYSSLVNGGKYNTVTQNNEIISKRVLSEENSKLMQKYLRDVVLLGSGNPANIDNVEVMGKTGTSNKIKDGKYVEKDVVSTFVGNFEHNGINYAILVLIDEPQPLEETFGFATAGWNAVPIAKVIIDNIIKNNQS